MTKTTQKTNILSLRLCEEKGDTTTVIDAAIKDNGDLVLAGLDTGKAPEHIWGQPAYQYSLTVASQHKDKVLLFLLERLYAGSTQADTEFQGLLNSKEIPFLIEHSPAHPGSTKGRKPPVRPADKPASATTPPAL